MKTIGYVILAIIFFIALVAIWTVAVKAVIWFITEALSWWLIGFLMIFFNLECISVKATKTNELLAKLVEIKGGGE